jgi:hypothetical protein
MSMGWLRTRMPRCLKTRLSRIATVVLAEDGNTMSGRFVSNKARTLLHFTTEFGLEPSFPDTLSLSSIARCFSSAEATHDPAKKDRDKILDLLERLLAERQVLVAAEREAPHRVQ